jgi:hypothetical protein
MAFNLARAQRSLYRTTAAKLAKAAANKTRRAVATTKKRKDRILANTKAIAKLQSQLYGERQCQTSYMDTKIHVKGDRPVIFHVNNPLTDGDGPLMYRQDAIGEGVHKIDGSEFDMFDQNTMYSSVTHREKKNKPNGPTLKLEWVSFQFRFHAFAADTRVRIDIVRRKRLAVDYWNQNKHANFLPNTLPQFNHICGYHPNMIQRKDYDIIKTKFLYLNSAPSNDVVTAVADAADSQTDDVSEATTVPTKYCSIYLPFRKVLTQLNSTTDQKTSVVNNDMAVSGSLNQSQSGWAFDNQNPMNNVFAIVSTDSMQVNPLARSAVKFDVIRRMCWRDRQE